MITRRNLLTASAATAGVLAVGSSLMHTAAQETELQLQNASFIADPVAASDGTPAASPVAADSIRGYILGDPDAAHTMQIFSDYRCPHCRDFYANAEASLIADFVQTGKLNLELIDFTVVGVPSFEELHIDVLESVQAAEAAACAAEQDAYLAYREWLFDGPMVLNPGDFADSKLIKQALDMGLDVEQFVTSLAEGKFEASVIGCVTLGISRGVQGTPTFTLDNGEPFYMPAEGYDALKQQLEGLIG